MKENIFRLFFMFIYYTNNNLAFDLQITCIGQWLHFAKEKCNKQSY